MTRSSDFSEASAALGGAFIRAVIPLSLLLGVAVGCSSDDSDSTSDDGGSKSSGGATNTGGVISVGGSANVGGAGAPPNNMTAGSSNGGSSNGGATSSGGAGAPPGNGTASQPLGGICANDSNCAQSEGETVCCASSCTLADQCPSSPLYLPCESQADCAAFGGGKVCCELGSGSTLMRFCTKPSACSGDTLP